MPFSRLARGHSQQCEEDEESRRDVRFVWSSLLSECVEAKRRIKTGVEASHDVRWLAD